MAKYELRAQLTQDLISFLQTRPLGESLDLYTQLQELTPIDENGNCKAYEIPEELKDQLVSYLGLLPAQYVSGAYIEIKTLIPMEEKNDEET